MAKPTFGAEPNRIHGEEVKLSLNIANFLRSESHMSLPNSQNEPSHGSLRTWFTPTHFDALSLVIVCCLILRFSVSVHLDRISMDLAKNRFYCHC